jgi:hypothetical protein
VAASLASANNLDEAHEYVKELFKNVTWAWHLLVIADDGAQSLCYVQTDLKHMCKSVLSRTEDLHRQMYQDQNQDKMYIMKWQCLFLCMIFFDIFGILSVNGVETAHKYVSRADQLQGYLSTVDVVRPYSVKVGGEDWQRFTWELFACIHQLERNTPLTLKGESALGICPFIEHATSREHVMMFRAVVQTDARRSIYMDVGQRGANPACRLTPLPQTRTTAYDRAAAAASTTPTTPTTIGHASQKMFLLQPKTTSPEKLITDLIEQVRLREPEQFYRKFKVYLENHHFGASKLWQTMGTSGTKLR